MPVPGGNVHGHLLVAVLTLGVAVAPASAGQGGSPVLFDRGMTVGAGATVSATLGETIARAEDAIVPARLFNERGVGRRAANITYRVSKLLFFDLPQEQWLLVVNHEVMGHGARLRERFDGFIGYTIDPPAPYGPGGGTTFFRFDREPTIVELQAVTAGGMEANAVAARVVADRAFSRGQMRVRDAIRYLGFELDTLTYILGTDRDLERESRGHDVAQFLRTYNAVAQEVGAPGVSVSTLRREALVSLANPMIAIAAYGIGRYLWNGAADAAVPALSWGGVRYLPLVRYQLAPYGMEWAATTHISSAGWPTRIRGASASSAAGSPRGARGISISSVNSGGSRTSPARATRRRSRSSSGWRSGAAPSVRSSRSGVVRSGFR